MSWLNLLRWMDLLDVIAVGVLIWFGIRFLRRTRGRAAFAGMALLGGFYLLARALELRLTAAIFQGFFAVLVLVLVVVFQTELRRLFEQLGSWRRGSAPPRTNEPLDALVRSVARLASTRTGALIVIPGDEPLESHVEGGVPLDARLSEPLLLSLFDTSSPGHDGAVILRGARLERFAVHLPLSSNRAALGLGGTRHAAALGLAERCDASCIVVSEERGTISLARDGELRLLSGAEDLADELRGAEAEASGPRHGLRGDAGRDAALAALGAVAAWLLFVPGSALIDLTVPAEVRLANLPAELELVSIEPSSIDVTVRGLRRDMVLAERSVSVHVDAYLARFGRRTFQVERDAVRVPDDLDVVQLSPDRVVISLQPTVSAEDGT